MNYFSYTPEASVYIHYYVVNDEYMFKSVDINNIFIPMFYIFNIINIYWFKWWAYILKPP